MGGFKIDNFSGVTPRLGPRLLPNNGAQLSNNTKLFSGELRPWQGATSVNAPSNGGPLISMYRMYDTSSNSYWLTWQSDVDVVKGPVAGDTTFKTYYTGDTSSALSAAGPRKTNLALAKAGGTNYPMDYLEMGVPAPASAPVVTVVAGTGTIIYERVYTYTYVTGSDAQGTYWGEEGPPNPIGGTGTGSADATWTITGFSTNVGGKYAINAADGATINLYRTLTDDSGNTNYQLATSVPVGTTSVIDTTLDVNLGIVAPTFNPSVVGSDWIAPPVGLRGLIAMPNGILVGFSGNLLCFSQPYFPYAWPTMYQLAVEWPIVSLGVYGQTVIVTTLGYPYAVSGPQPGQMSMERIEENHPCISKRSTVSFSFGVAWATPNGLAIAGVGGVVNAVEPFMKRDEWQANCFPATIIATQYQDVYFGFFNNGVTGANFIFDKAGIEGPSQYGSYGQVGEQQGILTFGNFSAQGAWADPTTALLYLLQNNVITQWDSDNVTPAAYDWLSKIFVLPKPVNFGAFQVDGAFVQPTGTSSAIAAQKAADQAVNAIILGTGNADTVLSTAWAPTTTYSAGNLVRSTSGVNQAVCITGGVSSSTEFAYPGTIGGTATDGGVTWRRTWQQQGVTKGDTRGQLLRNHTQYTTADPPVDGTAGNQWGFPLMASLLQGGVYPSVYQPSLLLQVYAMPNGSTATAPTLQGSVSLTSRTPVRATPKGFESDTWMFELSGNVNVRYFKVAETMSELAKIQ